MDQPVKNWVLKKIQTSGVNAFSVNTSRAYSDYVRTGIIRHHTGDLITACHTIAGDLIDANALLISKKI